MLIYKITNKINGKIYIGQTTIDLQERWREHCENNRCSAISGAVKKYGKENFRVDQIAIAFSIEELNTLEEKFIRELNSLSPKGYNLLKGGDNKRHHEETCKKISKSLTGKKLSARAIEKRSLALRGRKRPPHIGINMSLARKGKPTTGGAAKGIPKPHLRKSVIGIDIKTQKILEFDGPTFAEKVLNIDACGIIRCTKGKQISYKGYIWQYKNKTE